jgi:hypothetical protein
MAENWCLHGVNYGFLFLFFSIIILVPCFEKSLQCTRKQYKNIFLLYKELHALLCYCKGN